MQELGRTKVADVLFKVVYFFCVRPFSFVAERRLFTDTYKNRTEGGRWERGRPRHRRWGGHSGHLPPISEALAQDIPERYSVVRMY
jgi:hypothetical protein